MRLKDFGGAPDGVHAVDFSRPAGAAALTAPDSVTWRVFKNPVALFIGGITAVLLELAEPRVRTGVWEHTTFRTDPIGRMRRTGYAAMVTVYGPRAAAEAMIAGVSRQHARVAGVTPEGVAYRADDPELLDWVQATAAFGFLTAYHRFAHPLTQSERDRFHAEGAPAAALYGATGAPTSEAACAALFARVAPLLAPHKIVFEFLDIVRRAPIAPAPLRGVQRLLIKAAIDCAPADIRARIGLASRFSALDAALVRALGAAGERVVLKDAPPAQACVRMGHSSNFLYRRA